ncbi:MAG: hypothetical protein K6C36_06705, partial [Clostridia bacterium]|nr:hypothetical protein [Clostridia bacterium]
YLLERRLRSLDPELHKRFTDTVFISQHVLAKFRRLFPEFTDHSVFHSMNVLIFCNQLIGTDRIDELNKYDLYVLLMSCYLHDTGMAITQSDYEEFKNALGAKEYFSRDPSRTVADFVRDYHHEFSGLFIKKYAGLLEIPSPELTFAIAQVCRGHRRVDLFDTDEYPAELKIGEGKTVHLPYLAALIRLADEIDVAADRNPTLLYDIEALTDRHQIACHLLLQAVPAMHILPEGFLLDVRTDDEMLYLALEKLSEKMQATLDLCREVVLQRTPFGISQEWVRINRIS